MTYLLAGAALGVAGSVHCAGMCGPLLLAVYHGVSRAQTLQRMTVYHAARLFTYALLGIPAGYAAHALSFGVFGRIVGASAGVLLIVAATGSFAPHYRHTLSQAWSSAVVGVGAKAAMLTRRHPHYGYIVLGAINGLLPCGLVYAAVAGAAATGSVAAAVTFMIGFGVGTVPLLMAVTVSASSVPAVVRRRLRFVAPALIGLAGLLLIVRAFLPAEGTGHHQHGRERRVSEISASGQITDSRSRAATPPTTEERRNGDTEERKPRAQSREMEAAGAVRLATPAFGRRPQANREIENTSAQGNNRALVFLISRSLEPRVARLASRTAQRRPPFLRG